MKKITFILIAVLSLTVVSCSKRIAYTEEIRKEYDLSLIHI